VAVRDWAEVRKGVPARAAAAGTVLRVRDGVDDKAEPPKGQECGNGIVVDHGRGWTTQYCHLRRDSIVVKSGQPVRAGDALGMIGQSGRADFPHVHLQVARDGKIIDPFKGEGAPLGGCGLGQGHLWSAAALSLLTPHKPTAVFNSGIAAEEPDPAKARDGAYAGAVLRADAAILAVWADIYWAMAGDAVRLRMLSPAGAVLAEATRAVELTQARRFLYVGLRRKDAAWPAGVYKFEIVVLRTKDGAAGEISRRTGQAEVR
ncbi:MAG: M23 family metallopeptidase, partial [Alphaproteobacteria bacterium]|nr:M23 family metallopeptidase [Alphaproteobacteria bacterium]